MIPSGTRVASELRMLPLVRTVDRSNWVGLVPFLIALVVREIFTLHSVQEIEIQFAQGPVGRHSVVYPLLQMLFTPMVRDPHRFVMHMNGVLGAVACLAMYFFIRQRLASRTAGFLCALFLACDPLVARFSPTDGPYAFLLAAWFSGLALLSTPDLDGRPLFAGAVLIGIAATARIEGIVILAASLLLLDVRRLLGAARRHRIVAVATFLVVYGLGALQMSFLFPADPGSLSGWVPPPRWLFYDAVWPVSYRDHVFLALVWIGAAAGLLSHFRLGLLGYLAMVVVLAPVAQSAESAVTLHRMIPACAVQAMVAGIGAYSLAAGIRWMGGGRWLAALPGIVAAAYVLVEHRGDLTTPYVFNEEYALVRNHLAPNGVAATDCTLLTFNANYVGDIDLHDFGQVVPRVRIVDCRRTDCVAALPDVGCLYYVRSVASYYQAGHVPQRCIAAGGSTVEDRLACMDDGTASFERAVELQPVELKVVGIADTFRDPEHSPETAQIGLFRVHSKAAVAPAKPSAPPESARQSPQAHREARLAAAAGPDDEPVIPGGQDGLLETMLGKGATLPGGCTLAGAEARYTTVRATYACSGGESVFELAHPSTAPAAAIHTARFALTLLRGSPPPDLAGALESLIRSREAAFEWKFLPRKRLSPAFVPLAVAGLLGIAVLGWVLRRPVSSEP